jgi:hypothetical protein
MIIHNPHYGSVTSKWGAKKKREVLYHAMLLF